MQRWSKISHDKSTMRDHSILHHETLKDQSFSKYSIFFMGYPLLHNILQYQNSCTIIFCLYAASYQTARTQPYLNSSRQKKNHLCPNWYFNIVILCSTFFCSVPCRPLCVAPSRKWSTSRTIWDVPKKQQRQPSRRRPRKCLKRKRQNLSERFVLFLSPKDASRRDKITHSISSHRRICMLCHYCYRLVEQINTHLTKNDCVGAPRNHLEADDPHSSLVFASLFSHLFTTLEWIIKICSRPLISQTIL